MTHISPRKRFGQTSSTWFALLFPPNSIFSSSLMEGVSQLIMDLCLYIMIWAQTQPPHVLRLSGEMCSSYLQYEQRLVSEVTGAAAAGLLKLTFSIVLFTQNKCTIINNGFAWTPTTFTSDNGALKKQLELN